MTEPTETDVTSPILKSRRGSSLVLTINRPDDSNRVNAAAMRAINAGVDEANVDPSVRTIILTGSRDAFCSGGRIDGHPGGTVEQQLVFANSFCALQASLGSAFVPVIAAVEGPCTAGGMSLLAACDIAIAADDVHFSFPEINFGLFPVLAMGVAHPLVPPKVALDWFFTGRNISSAEALSHNLINEAVPHGTFWQAVDAMAEQLASKSATALNLGRKAYYAMAPMGPAARLDYAQTALTTMLAAVGDGGAVPR